MFQASKDEKKKLESRVRALHKMMRKQEGEED